MITNPLHKEEDINDVIKRTGNYPVYGVHRGGGGSFGPENTLYSFQKCLYYRVRLFELDIRLTKDKELVIMHDSSVERTTNGSGPLKQFTLKELKLLDAAFYYPSLQGKGITVPTLKEFLALFAPVKDLLFIFDFKDDESILRALPLIDSYQIGNRFILASVFGSSNQLLRESRLSLRVPVITDITQTFKLILAYGMNALAWVNIPQDVFGFVLLDRTRKFFTKGLVAAIHQKGLKVLVCGEELSKVEVVRECVSFGVDFILTDRPDLLNSGL